MLKKSPVVAALTLALAAGAQADAQLDLGNRERVTRLFAFPNNCSVICYRNWTLEQTVEHYLTQSVQRDGYAAAKVTVSANGDELQATISGVPAGYSQPLAQLLKAGDLAYQGAAKLNQAGGWAYDWYFFLPLGMALENRKSLELLHFPPDYSLTQAQDYLESKTTDRWDTLLVQNGVDKTLTAQYQTIVDIAPIAAPASAGDSLAKTYDYFTAYQTQMLQQITQGQQGTSLPVVAFGAPVRNWVKQQYGQTVAVLGLVTIAPAQGQKTPVLGANHPSYIWYAADPATYNGDEQKADRIGLTVMGQDLTAACWQAAIGRTPGADPQATLSACGNKWQVAQSSQTCELFYESIRNLPPEQAQAKCTTAPAKAAQRQLKQPMPLDAPADR
ncbi:hypothetical protein [Pseudomonas typographi]|uniref:hypothetical protein n=1 Tax=Pseudomonas typographi TaxID=2715964 RepID=UPI0016865DED|nr:hypothetical protein [Pseudomonas typographi]MBD1590143.1 hypothetical protein [Pseudomonas typographi]